MKREQKKSTLWQKTKGQKGVLMCLRREKMKLSVSALPSQWLKAIKTFQAWSECEVSCEQRLGQHSSTAPLRLVSLHEVLVWGGWTHLLGCSAIAAVTALRIQLGDSRVFSSGSFSSESVSLLQLLKWSPACFMKTKTYFSEVWTWGNLEL